MKPELKLCHYVSKPVELYAHCLDLLSLNFGGKSSFSALYTWFAVITCVAVTCQNHVASIVRDASVFL